MAVRAEEDLSKENIIQLTMIYEENRQASFKQWIFDNNQICNATRMAQAGFYSVATEEEPDAAKCFLCDKVLDGWEADDDPFAEHLSHSTHCSFAKLQLPEDDITLKQFQLIRLEQIKNIINKHYDEVIAARSEWWHKFIEQIKLVVNERK